MLKIEELLRARKLSKGEFYARCGISSSSLSQWRTGKNLPSPYTVEKIAEFFRVSVEELVGQKDETPLVGEERFSVSARRLAELYDSLDMHGQRMVDTIAFEEQRRMATEKPRKVVPLFGASFAAGYGEPDFGNPWEQFEVDADSPAEFAIRVHGDSMSPYLEDGSVALGRHGTPRDGDVAALLVDGEFFVKQIARGADGDLYLLSLNRERSDCDKVIKAGGGRSVTCFGVIIMPRVPLPEV